MNHSNVRLQADDFNLPGPVHVVGLVAVAVLAVQVLGHGGRSQFDSSTELDKLFLLGAGLQDSDVVENDWVGLEVLELLLLGQPLVVGNGVDAVGGGSGSPSIELLVVDGLGRLDQILQNFHVELLHKGRNCYDAFRFGLVKM